MASMSVNLQLFLHKNFTVLDVHFPTSTINTIPLKIMKYNNNLIDPLTFILADSYSVYHSICFMFKNIFRFNWLISFIFKCFFYICLFSVFEGVFRVGEKRRLI